MASLWRQSNDCTGQDVGLHLLNYPAKLGIFFGSILIDIQCSTNWNLEQRDVELAARDLN